MSKKDTSSIKRSLGQYKRRSNDKIQDVNDFLKDYVEIPTCMNMYDMNINNFTIKYISFWYLINRSQSCLFHLILATMEMYPEYKTHVHILILNQIFSSPRR